MEDKGFALDRINGVIKRLKEANKQKPQMSLETFFGKPKKIEKEDLKSKSKSKVPDTKKKGKK